MIKIDCSELSADEKLALASMVSDSLEGRAILLSKGEDIVLDNLTEQAVGVDEVRGLVERFVQKREDHSEYAVEVERDLITVRSPDPIAAKRNQREKLLPPNVFQCPFCPYVTTSEGLYRTHSTLHFL